uniref:Uncharacterized protein n=1 Tax=Meloidogyne hapla TaxID=6305 RepID=A0A1I8B697_MELHA
MSAHFRAQISLLNTEALELLNNKKDFPLPPRNGDQTDKEYKRLIETTLKDLEAEQEEIQHNSPTLKPNGLHLEQA